MLIAYRIIDFNREGLQFVTEFMNIDYGATNLPRYGQFKRSFNPILNTLKIELD